MALGLQSPDEIRIGPELRALLRDVDEERRRLREMGDFPPDVRDEIRSAFLPERISDTLNIEGVHVNPRVTRSVLEGLALADTDRYTEREILNIIDANDLIEELAKRAIPITPGGIREVQRRAMSGLMQTPGAFREEDVKISGALFEPPPWGDVPDLVSEISSRFEALLSEFPEEHSIVTACWLHASLSAVHPFSDGNGRTARLLEDYALIRDGLLPVGIPARRRQEYYDALASADGGDWEALIAIVADSELRALERAIRIAEAPARRRERIKSLVAASKGVRKQRAYNQYELWRRRMDAIRQEFERWAETLNEEDESLFIRVKVWDPISFEKWAEIREVGRAVGTRVFTLNFHVDRRRVLSCLFYARRHEFTYTLDHDPEALRKAVGLFLTAAPEGEGEFSFGRFRDPYMRLRELVYAKDGRLFAYRDPGSIDREADLPEGIEVELASDDRWRCEEGPELASLVEELLNDTFLKLGLKS